MAQSQQRINVDQLDNAEYESASISNDDKRSKFEDLPNELIYEIFEFLEGLHVYTSFPGLNNRFRQLLVQSSLPLKLHFRLTSQGNLRHYYTYIVKPNMDRIVSISLLHPNIVNHFLTSVLICPSFAQLESLVIDNIESDRLLLLLEQLSLLPRLFSLSVYADGKVHYSQLYDAIFALPLLKYCKVFIVPRFYSFGSLKPINHSCNIEYLTITVPSNWREIDAIIAHVPRLRHLVVDFDDWLSLETVNLQNRFCDLTHLSLEIRYANFSYIKRFIIAYSVRLKVLRIRAQDSDYLNANQWQQLIICHIPNLIKFHLHVRVNEMTNDGSTFHSLIDKFKSSFWYTHQWFFDHCHRTTKKSLELIFYSIEPDRVNHELYNMNSASTCHIYKTDCSYTRHLIIQGQKTIPDCARRYSHVTKLTIDNIESKDLCSLIIDLKQLIFLKQLTELVVHTNDLSIITLLGLLRHSPNINSLTVPADILSVNLPKRLLKKVTYMMANNRITKVIIDNVSTFENVRTLVDICPRLEHLEIKVIEEKYLKPIFELLYSRHTNHGCHFFYLCLDMSAFERTKIPKKIRSHYKHLVDGCLIQNIDSKQYFWW